MEKVTCKRLDDNGRGIAEINNKITFIPNLLPEEEALIEITKQKKNYNEGKVIELLAQSKNRIIPECSYTNCGCHLNHLTYEEELKYKEEKIKNIIKKYAHIEPKINKIIYDNNIKAYRNKITLKVQNKLGYHHNNTNEFFEIKKCLLVSDKINNIIEQLNKENLSKVKEITIKEFNQIMLIINGKMNIDNIKNYVDTIYMNNELVYGNKYIQTQIDDLTFNISKESFFQVNKYILEKLYKEAISKLKGNQTVLDLYCGTGTITLLLSKHFKKVIGIELNKEAIECANLNKKQNNITNVEFICGDASKEITKINNIESLVVDPPRSGLTKEGIEDIFRINPKEIVYISCDPITLARDLNILKEKYNIKEVTPVNMFPRTYHCESLVVLERIDK